MKNRLKTLILQEKAIIFLILFFIPFHLCCTPDYWDDAVFARALNDFQYNLIKYTSYRYTAGSSRITIELVLPFMAVWHNLWKIVNLLMIVLLFFDLKWFLVNIFKIPLQKLDILLALLLGAYPFSAMAQTGWISTSMNYLWVIALGWYAINRMLKSIMTEEPISKREIFFSFFAVLYSASYESMAAILFAISLGIILYSLKRKGKISGVVWCCIGITILLLIYILCCPGNRSRLYSDAENWMPNYFDMTFLDRIRVAILSAFMHFVSIPSPLFFIFNFVLLLLSGVKNGKVRLAAALPMVLDIGWTCYFLVHYLPGGGRTFTYQVPTALPIDMADKIEQALLLLSVLLWFIIVLHTIFQNLPTGKAIWCTCLLFLGCAPEMAVGITSTVYASILRTTIYLYLIMIILIVCMLQEITLKENIKIQRFLYFCLGCGVFLNACQMARHIMIYG